MIIRDIIVNKIGRMIPDKIWLQIKFYQHFHRFCDFKNPKTYNEKLQWLKLYDRKEKYSMMVDKFRVKEYVANKIGKEYVISSIGGPWKSFNEIDFNKLPDEFVLKTNHDCGGIVICKNKSSFNFDFAEKFLNKHLKNDYFIGMREWPYKNVKPIIFAEKYMTDESGYELKDYKFFCFNGEPKLMYIASDRQSDNEELKFDFYDMNFNRMPFTNAHPNSDKNIKCPQSFEKMKVLAAKLSEGIPQVRVDFYEVNGKIYFGELTFFHMSGLASFEPEEWDYKLGSWIDLPSVE